MSRRNNRRRVHNVTSIGKAATQSLPAGTVAISAQALIAALQQTVVPAESDPLPRPDAWLSMPFGPGMPLVPRPINAPVDGGSRPAPRRYDYPTSFNLPGVDQRMVPWKVLRDAGDQIDLFRRCIEERKNEVRGYGWDIVVSERALESARRDDPTSTDTELGRALRDSMADQIARLRTWWEMPDRTNGLDFKTWVAQVMEEHLVIDALAIWPRMTVGGDLYSLEVLDGTTIKPLLDDRGNTPMPPFPAYQQVLLGFPRGEFTADAVEDADGHVLIPDAYLRDQLIYERWNIRTHSPYGFSVVEQALGDADLWLKRQGWMRAEYTDGVMPAGWLTTDAAYTPDQLRAYNAVFNDYLSGNTRERMRVQALPKGFTPVDGKSPEERYRPHFDEFLLKLVCSHFGVLPSRLGFTPQSGLGGKGHQEGEEDTQERQSTRPVTEWLAALFTRISRTMLAMPEELCFQFINLDAEDEDAADEAEDRRVKSGRSTLNESRDRLGQPRFDFPEADMPMIVTASGVIFIEGEQERQAQQQEQSAAASQAMVEAKQAGSAGGFGAGGPAGAKAGAGQGAGSTTAQQGGKQADAGKAGKPSDKAKSDEYRALDRWLTKRQNPSRPFICQHLTKADLTGLTVREGLVVPKADDAPREDVAGLDRARRGDGPARPGRGTHADWARY